MNLSSKVEHTAECYTNATKTNAGTPLNCNWETLAYYYYMMIQEVEDYGTAGHHELIIVCV